MDRQLAHRLNNLSEHQAHEDKLALAIEEGRVYGLRQQKYGMTLKRELNHEYRKAPVEHAW